MNSFERKPSSQAVIVLTAGRLCLELSPSTGGAISAFEWFEKGHSHPIMRPRMGPLEQVLDACSFPLVPYVNRIRDGSFEFRGKTVILEPNMAGDRNPLHGQGWLASWDVQRADTQSAVLIYRHEPGEWPWRYEACQEIALDDAGLTILLRCRNLADEPMPCGLGQHPYFPCGSQTVIDAEVDVAWTVDEQVLPTGKVPAVGHYDLKNRFVCGQGLDNGFGGWTGLARISDPAWPYELGLSSPNARFFQVYSPKDGGIFVAEPVSHANAAMNAPETHWPELGMKVLGPAEEMSLAMRLDVIAL